MLWPERVVVQSKSRLKVRRYIFQNKKGEKFLQCEQNLYSIRRIKKSFSMWIWNARTRANCEKKIPLFVPAAIMKCFSRRWNKSVVHTVLSCDLFIASRRRPISMTTVSLWLGALWCVDLTRPSLFQVYHRLTKSSSVTKWFKNFPIKIYKIPKNRAGFIITERSR